VSQYDALASRVRIRSRRDRSDAESLIHSSSRRRMSSKESMFGFGPG